MKSLLTVFGILILANLLILSVLFVPQAAFAQSFTGPLVPQECNNGAGSCAWPQLVQLGKNIMRFGIYLLGICAVIGIVYAGWLYISSDGSSGKISQAHGIFTKIIYGIFFTLAAWLIVQSILRWLGVKDGFSLLVG